MNLPSSLALPQSKLFQSRIGLIILLLVVALVGLGVFFFVLRPTTLPKTPTVATSPAAIATPRPAMKQVVYGPPAPSWVPRAPMPSAVPGPATPLASSVPGTAAAVVPGTAASSVPGTAASSVPGTTASTVPGTTASTVPGTTAPTAPVALPLGAPVIPGGATLTAEVPKSLDASVLFARESYTYTSGKRRDPFASLLAGKFQTSGDGSLVDVGDIHLVGIMWGASDKFALVEDTRGRGFVLRVGDPVLNGYISGITKSEIQVVQSAFGESQTLAIQLKPKEGDKNATRQ